MVHSAKVYSLLLFSVLCSLVSLVTSSPILDIDMELGSHNIDSFFQSSHYAVVGASSDEEKYGTIVFKKLLESELSAYAINPYANVSQGHQTIPALCDLPVPASETSISIVTQPSVTLTILRQAIELGIRAIWIQPGAADNVVVEYIKQITQRVDSPVFIYSPIPAYVRRQDEGDPISGPCDRGHDIISTVERRLSGF